jgi:outer membrane usher protein FimD/PapC
MTTTGNVAYANNHTRLRVSGRATQNAGGQNSESLSLETYSSVFYADGKLAMAASRGQEGAALVADLTGSAKGQTMRIISNGRNIGTAKVGERIAIYVEPFRTYTFSLEPDGKDDLVSFSTDKFIVTLYPGNVTTRQWIVNKAILAFGRLIDPEGNPIIWKRIAGMQDNNILTDGFGYFSVEYTGREMPYISSDANRCTFAMPHIDDATEYFTNLGDVVCL